MTTAVLSIEGAHDHLVDAHQALENAVIALGVLAQREDSSFNEIKTIVNKASNLVFDALHEVDQKIIAGE